MFPAKSTIGFPLVVLLILFYRAECKCNFKVSSLNKPLLTQEFGSKVIVLSSDITNIEIEENTEVQAYCSTGFDTINTGRRDYYDYRARPEYSKKNSLSFGCRSDGIHVYAPATGDVDRSSTLSSQDIACRSTVYSMYESKDNLTKCDNFQSYALAAELTTPIILAGLCYDLDDLKLKFVSYKPHAPLKVLENEKKFYPEGLSESSLGEVLSSTGRLFPSSSAPEIGTAIDNQALTNYWLRIADYELDSIIQTTTNKIVFDEFHNFFNIIWWNNLRKGNWRIFMDLLEKRSRTPVYDVYTGISGALRIPYEYDCEKENILEINYQGKQRPVPQFVWAYLRSTAEDPAEDFVAIAYNSPYFEYFDKDITVLCKDMCDEIHWLKPMNRSRSISTMGRFYCCRPQDVVGLLDGFPVKPSIVTEVKLESTVAPVINSVTII